MFLFEFGKNVFPI